MKVFTKLVLFMGLFMFHYPLFGQAKREVLSLDRGWSFHLGDIEFPEVKGHSASYQNAKAGRAGGAASPNYDASAWRIVDLPHDWAIEGEVTPDANLSQGYYKRGISWYRRSFKLAPEDKGKHIEIQFDGIATYATIWVNGTLLHRNWCGYTSMYIDITPYATYGDQVNTIAVRVDADAQEGWWYEGAGIYRHTWLIKRSPLHIQTDGVFANPIKRTDDNWQIPIEVSLYNAGKDDANAEIEVTLFSPQGEKMTSGITNTSVLPLREGITHLSLSIDKPQLWSPESPTLYRVETVVRQNQIEVDKVDTRCGFRTIRFDSQTGFWLNGKNMKIKGVCCHQDHAGVGVAVPDALWEFRLRKLKDMGVNAYRVAHNPTAKEFMAACDSMGIMVLDENRIFNTSPEYTRQLEWLVRRDRNCPSVILWSVFNEEPMQGSENGYEMVRRMSDVVKRLDTTRPVTAAMNGGFFEPYNVSQAVDVGGFNYQIKSYDRFHEENPHLPLTSSEDGSAFMVRGEYTTDKTHNLMDSYDTQCANWGATHREAWRAVAERPWMAGCFYWTGFDYHGEPTPFAWPSVSSFFGIMDLCGFPKMAYHLHKAQWRTDVPVLELVPHWNWPEDTIGKPIQVMALSNADKVELRLNGKVISEQIVDSFEMNTWMVPYQPGKLEALGYKDGKLVSRTKVETTKSPHRLRLTPYRTILQADGHDAVPITVEMLDSKGRHVPTANHMVHFAISGPARIIGLGNGNPNCHELEKGNKRSLFNGLAQVIIQSTGETGDITLTTTSEGVKMAEVTIHTQTGSSYPYVAFVNPAMLVNNWTSSPQYKERPDVNQTIAENDMNSWQPRTSNISVRMEEGPYIILRSVFTPSLPLQQYGGKITFQKLNGKAEIWLNGTCIGKKENGDAADFVVPIQPNLKECDLRILFERNSINRAGMRGCIIN